LKKSLQAEFGSQIEDIILTPSHGGRFEVTVDDRLIYSKLATGRHAQPGEVEGLVRKILEEKS
jgi:selenoprotein W-related protein